MKFNWNKIYKWEVSYIEEIKADVIGYIAEFYDVMDAMRISEEEYNEVKSWVSECYLAGPMTEGFNNFFTKWEEHNVKQD